MVLQVCLEYLECPAPQVFLVDQVRPVLQVFQAPPVYRVSPAIRERVAVLQGCRARSLASFRPPFFPSFSPLRTPLFQITARCCSHYYC